MSLFLKIAKYKNGKTFLSIVDGYRDENRKVKQIVIKKLGYLNELEKEYANPIEHFKQVVKSMKLENSFTIPDSLSKNEGAVMK